MRKIFLFIGLVYTVVAVSCSGSRKASAYSEDRAFYEAVKKLSRKPNDGTLKKDVIDLYQQAVVGHRDRISAFQASSDLRRFDNTVSELNALQKLSDAIKSNSVFREVEAPNYFSEVQKTKEEGAEAYYQAALSAMDEDTKAGYRRASDYFRRSMQFVAGYKDSESLQRIAQEKSIVNVLINPIQEGFYTMAWNPDMRIRFIHERLVRDLGGQFGNAGSGRFFTEMDARRLNIRPDWVVDISWNNLSVPPSVINRYDRQVQRNIEIGKDTSGRPVYQTVKAVLHVMRYENPGGDIDYRIVDVESNINLEWNRVNVSNVGRFETATFSGDSRALGQNDWALVNNRWNGMVSDDMIRQMYDRLLIELRSALRNRMY